jgi:ketosteroid isomerase-like protein
MTTKAIVEKYLDALKRGTDWEPLFAPSMTFTSFSSPVKQVVGCAAFVMATQRFYASVMSVDVRTLIVDGDRACALTHYDLRSPTGNVFTSDVAEIFHVTDGKIDSFEIYFDTAPFPR